MSKEVDLTFYLDTRRSKGQDLYPLKLRWYKPSNKEERLLRTGYSLSQEEYNQVYKQKEPLKPRERISKDRKKEITEIIDILKEKAGQIIKDLNEITFDEFEKRFYNKSSRLDICDYYKDYIKKLTNEGRIRTAESYRLSLDRLIEFINHNKKTPAKVIPFESINSKKLQQFEDYYLSKEENRLSPTSIGIYLRPLRAIFNTAINDRNSGLKQEAYPFGKNKYTIPTGQNIKKSLTPKQLKILFEAVPENKHQQKAKDFWFFSYLANGINFKDIAELRFENLRDNKLSFYRAKTKNTTKGKQRLIQAILPEYALNTIHEYGQPNTNKHSYIFTIIKETDSPLKASNKIKAFTRFVNQHIKLLAIKNGLPEDISTYWARHSFTTQAINKGASMELLQESLGHMNLSTTQNYFAGFNSEIKENLSKSLLDF